MHSACQECQCLLHKTEGDQQRSLLWTLRQWRRESSQEWWVLRFDCVYEGLFLLMYSACQKCQCSLHKMEWDQRRCLSWTLRQWQRQSSQEWWVLQSLCVCKRVYFNVQCLPRVLIICPVGLQRGGLWRQKPRLHVRNRFKLKWFEADYVAFTRTQLKPVCV